MLAGKEITRMRTNLKRSDGSLSVKPARIVFYSLIRTTGGDSPLFLEKGKCKQIFKEKLGTIDSVILAMSYLKNIYPNATPPVSKSLFHYIWLETPTSSQYFKNLNSVVPNYV